ncbi:S8 family serine peptidase [Streptosporangium sp. NPDC023615]|uniref:S8 family serine peptidase n=1 Tax=Streptosporangium sp. NPDC023615 TaxID=3154794 RepID=UPI00343BBDC4
MLRPPRRRATGTPVAPTVPAVLAVLAVLLVLVAAPVAFPLPAWAGSPVAGAPPLPGAPSLPGAPPVPGAPLVPGASPRGAAPPDGAADAREDQRWVLEMLDAEEAWKVTRGAGVTVALVDSGVDDRVAELRGRVISGPDMGSVAFDRNRPDDARHGTAMASLIAGSGRGDGGGDAGSGGDDGAGDGSANGLLGIAPESRILSLPLIVEERPEDGSPLRDEDLRSGEDSPLARAIRYAVDHGAQVVSMSLGAYGPQRSEREAVSYALSKGVVLVAAVGNDGDSPYALEKGTSFWNFPAGYSGVIGVGAVDELGRPAEFSSDNLSIQVAAPGVGVPVVLPGGGYGSSEGTSSSTALVAGIAALIKAKYPDITPRLVARALTDTATSRPRAGYDDHVGFGVVNAAAALAEAGRLTAGAARVPLPVPEGMRFGEGVAPAEPARPGPEPARLWLYGTGLGAGVLAFAGAVVMLRRPGRSGPGAAGAAPAGAGATRRTRRTRNTATGTAGTPGAVRTAGAAGAGNGWRRRPRA